MVSEELNRTSEPPLVTVTWKRCSRAAGPTLLFTVKLEKDSVRLFT